MYFVIIAHDSENSLPLRKKHSNEHRSRLIQLQQQGKMLVAGPCPITESESSIESGVSGSIIIAEFENLATAQTWANEDPFLREGIYTSVSVKPFIKFLP